MYPKVDDVTRLMTDLRFVLSVDRSPFPRQHLVVYVCVFIFYYYYYLITMDSPQMYDSQLDNKKQHVNLPQHQQQHIHQSQQLLIQPQKRFTELHDLNSPEISLDLQNLIDDSQFNEGIFNDILTPKPLPNCPSRYQRLSYVPVAAHFQPQPNTSQLPPEVKNEESQDSNTTDFRYQNFTSPLLKNHLRKNGKQLDKNTDEYKRRRERNNIAVRKSREKAKMRSRETEEKVKILIKENERLQKRIELLTEELNVLRSLFSSVGVLPEHLHRELNKHLESYQQH